MKVGVSYGLCLVTSACPVLGSFSVQNDGVLGTGMHQAIRCLIGLQASFCKTA